LATWHERTIDYFFTDVHIAIFGSFPWAMLFDLLESKKRFNIPRNFSAIIVTWLYAATTLANIFHGRKCEYTRFVSEHMLESMHDLIPEYFLGQDKLYDRKEESPARRETQLCLICPRIARAAWNGRGLSKEQKSSEAQLELPTHVLCVFPFVCTIHGASHKLDIP
jgi:hypothetical protein